MITKEVYVEIEVLRKHGLSLRKIAAEVGCAVNTVRSHLAQGSQPRYQRQKKRTGLDRLGWSPATPLRRLLPGSINFRVRPTTAGRLDRSSAAAAAGLERSLKIALYRYRKKNAVDRDRGRNKRKSSFRNMGLHASS